MLMDLEVLEDLMVLEDQADQAEDQPDITFITVAQ